MQGTRNRTGSPGTERAAPSGRRRCGRVLLSAAVVASVLAGTAAIGVGPSVLAPQAAVAAEHAVGHDIGLGWLGAYRHPDGTLAYCLQINGGIPYSDTAGSALSSDWNGLSADELARLNYVLAAHGDTADPNSAAAVALYAWSVADRAVYDSHGMSGDDYYSPRAGSEREAVLALLAAYRSEAAGVSAAAPTPPAGSTAVDLAVDTATRTGSVTLRTEPGSLRTTVHLENAVFAGSGSADAEMTGGSTEQIRVVPNTAPTFRVAARSDDITVQAVRGYAGNITVWAPGKVAEQYTASRGQEVGGPFVVRGAATTTDEIDNRFSPVASTAVSSRRLDAGTESRDVVTTGVAEGSPGWRDLPDGAPAPVVYTGRLFGPFAEQPAESEQPAAGAPVVGEVSVTASGPGAVTAPGVRVAEAGFYSWVWSVDAADQTDATRGLLPADYRWADRFGLVAESNVVPFEVSAVSAVDGSVVASGARSTDALTLTSAGRWLSDGGRRVPVAAEGTAYWLPGETRPTEGAVPDGAVVLGTASLSFTEDGTKTASVDVPSDASGHVVWVWSIGQTLHHTAWSDAFGVPEEVSTVRVPTVVTSARPETALTDSASDQAVVDGVVPEGATLVFEAFRTAPGEQPRCTPDERVYDGASDPVAVRAGSNDGITYRSAEVRFDAPGSYAWIETLRTRQGAIIHRGACGAPGETTVVSVPAVTTRAQADVALTDAATDDAQVTGPTPPNAALVWRAYQSPSAPAGAQPVCTADTLVAETAPVRVDGPGSYTSPAVTFPAEGPGYWVEELRAVDGRVLASGRCGAENETTTVHRPGVRTEATPTVAHGADAVDTAIVDGWVPSGATLAFEAYRQSGEHPTCGIADRIADSSDAPVSVPAGFAESIRVESAAVRFETPGRYAWVETLRDRDGGVLHRGECGAPKESTVVTPPGDTPPRATPPALASTGSDAAGPLLGGLGALLAGGLALIATRIVQRRRTTRTHGVEIGE